MSLVPWCICSKLTPAVYSANMINLNNIVAFLCRFLLIPGFHCCHRVDMEAAWSASPPNCSLFTDESKIPALSRVCFTPGNGIKCLPCPILSSCRFCLLKIFLLLSLRKNIQIYTGGHTISWFYCLGWISINCILYGTFSKVILCSTGRHRAEVVSPLIHKLTHNFIQWSLSIIS